MNKPQKAWAVVTKEGKVGRFNSNGVLEIYETEGMAYSWIDLDEGESVRRVTITVDKE